MLLQTHVCRELVPTGHRQNPLQSFMSSSPGKLQSFPSHFDSRGTRWFNFPYTKYLSSNKVQFPFQYTSWQIFCPYVETVQSQELNFKERRHFVGRKLNCCSKTVNLLKRSVVKVRKKNYGGILPSILRSLECENDIEKVLEWQDVQLNDKELTVILKEQGSWEKVLRVFKWIKSQKDYSANVIHYNVVLRALGRAGKWDELRLCWIEMAKDGVSPTNNTYSMLVDVYGKAGLVKEALLWIKHMRLRGYFPDEVTMSTVLRVLKDAGEYDRADGFYKNWCSGNVELDDLDLDSMENPVTNIGLVPVNFKQFLLTELFRTGRRNHHSHDAYISRENTTRKPRLTATYNTLIDLYGKAGRLKDSATVFSEMLSSGVALDTVTFNTMIFISGSHGHLSEAEMLFDKMSERRIKPDTKTYNILLSLYANAGNIEAALRIYNTIRDAGLFPDEVTHRVLLRSLCERKMVHDVEKVIEALEKSGQNLDEHSLPGVVKMYVHEGLNEKANILFKKYQSNGCLSAKTYAAVIDVYAEKGHWAEAEAVFFNKNESIEMKREAVVYNVMIKAYGKSGHHDKAYALFKKMKNHGTWPDECTFNTIIQMLASGSDLSNQAKDLLAEMMDTGYKPSCQTFSAVIASYARVGRLTDAVDTFQEMLKAGVNPNEVVYGALIDGFAEAGEFEEAIKYCHEMEQSGIPVNRIILTSMIKAYGKIGSLEGAKQLYEKMKTLEPGLDIVAANSMLNLYAELGVVSEAESIFNELKEKGWADGVTFATMIYVYKNMGMLDEAIAIAEEMKASGLMIDSVSYNKVMACYATTNQLVTCGELLREMIDRKLLLENGTFKVLFSVLKKGDLPIEAIKQLELAYYEGKPYAKEAVITCVFALVGLHTFGVEFCEVIVKENKGLDSFAFNSAIYAYGSSGNSDMALNIFMRMQDTGLEPDIVTYIYLVNCYGKSGMVEGIKRIYSQLKCGFIEPNESLYMAIIDGFRNANRDDLSELVYQEMRFDFEAGFDPESEVSDDRDGAHSYHG